MAEKIGVEKTGMDFDGAEGGTRTRTGLPPLDPEAKKSPFCAVSVSCKFIFYRLLMNFNELCYVPVLQSQCAKIVPRQGHPVRKRSLIF